MSGCDGGASRNTVIVFAAASTGLPLEAIAEEWEQRHGVEIELSFAASSTLARQIEAGAPADIFISANSQWMDELEQRGLIEQGSRADLLANELVVVVPRDSALDALATDGGGDAWAAVGSIGVGDPAHVPAGIYARQALEALGWWDAVRDRLVSTVDVRAALRLAEMNEVDAAIVYASDAATVGRVRVVGRFDESLHDPITYPAALCRGAGPEAAAFFAHLRSAEAAEAFRAAGFAVVEGAAR